MSARNVTTIYCDWFGCDKVRHGTSPRDARKIAKILGWVNVVRGKKRTVQSQLDFCPEHAAQGIEAFK